MALMYYIIIIDTSKVLPQVVKLNCKLADKFSLLDTKIFLEYKLVSAAGNKDIVRV